MSNEEYIARYFKRSTKDAESDADSSPDKLIPIEDAELGQRFLTVEGYDYLTAE